MSHCPYTFQPHSIHTHTHALLHTLFLSWITFYSWSRWNLRTTEHSTHNMQVVPQLGELRSGVVWCWSREAWGRGGRQTSGSWTGGNATVASQIRWWMGSEGTSGWGGSRGGGNLLRHFYTSRGGHKSGKVMSFIVTHKRGLSNPFNQHNDEWWGKERCRGEKRNLNNIWPHFHSHRTFLTHLQ